MLSFPLRRSVPGAELGNGVGGIQGFQCPIEALDGGIVPEGRELVSRSGCEPRLGGGKHGPEARVIAEWIEVHVDLGVIQQAKGRSVEYGSQHFKRCIDVSPRQFTGEVVAHL